MLMTSLTEIRGFSPCRNGWQKIFAARKGLPEEQFPLVDCLQSNSVSDVCWLLGKRKKEIKICVDFAARVADSVSHLDEAQARIQEQARTVVAYANASTSCDAYADAVATLAAYAEAAYIAQQEMHKGFLRAAIYAFEKENSL